MFQERAIRGLFIIVRLCLLILCTALTLTTSPVELTDGRNRHESFQNSFPAHELAMMMTIAIRFIPTMEEADRIIKAQQARGLILNREA